MQSTSAGTGTYAAAVPGPVLAGPVPSPSVRAEQPVAVAVAVDAVVAEIVTLD